MNQIDTAHQNSSIPDAPITVANNLDLHQIEDPVGIEIQSLKAAAPSELDFRIKQNAERPIHSLPPEVLLQIIYLHMLFYQGDWGEEYYDRLISISGVCSHWYSVIRYSPPLWTQIHLSDSLKIVETALQRSSSHALDIILHPSFYSQEVPVYFQHFLGAVRPHSDRWRSMEVWVPRAWMESLLTALGEPAPKSERLSLADRDTTYCTRKVNLFGGVAPRLASLTLDGVSIQWDNEILQNLTALDLLWIHFPSTDAILRALSNCTQLQALSISHCATMQMATPSSPVIQFPQLSSLHVELGSQAETNNFLDQIEDDRDDAPSLLLSRRKRRRGIPEADDASVEVKEEVFDDEFVPNE
ncbi:hypothetical protein FS837_001369 [Tulasnella sp. UAMH 9824]|nr:hypothetical protein FS837_001369 [Tulasnella sp. UAMH 9824]